MSSHPTMSASNDRLVVALQHKLAASEERFNNLVFNAPDGSIVIDSAGIIRYLNPAAEALFGYSRDRLLGQTFGYPALAGNKAEIEILKPGGQLVLAEMRVVDIEWDGRPARLATLRDVSELDSTLAELRRVTKDLKQFASIVSHDVRSPLRNLYLLTGWLLDDHAASLNLQAMEDIQLIRSTTTRMQRLLEDLLLYIRVDRVKRMASDISLDQVLDDALDELSNDIAEHGAQIQREPLPVIDCNVQQMVTFFRHIISNSIVHSDTTPQIDINCTSNATSCRISISDNGIGIEERHIEDIFIPFNHLHSSKQHGGSGVGLATSKKIVECHGGRIWLESERGVGTTVFAELPLHPRAMSDQA